MKILNLYAGIGGNRMLWSDEHEVTAVEYNENIAKVYKEQYPNDKVIIADAHQYLLDHYKELQKRRNNTLILNYTKKLYF